MHVDRAGLTGLTEALARTPRLTLASLPTPLEEAPRLSSRLGVRLLIKRDDHTGLALGGNKVRKLEFLMADAVNSGADTVITTGGSQSNHARLTAAACRRAGLRCYLVLDRGVHAEEQGNLLLDSVLGAEVRLIDSSDPQVAIAEMEALRQDLGAAGRRPYVIPRGGSVPAGATGYAACASELIEQLQQREVEPDVLYLGTGSTGTHSGLLAGLAASGLPFPVQGISVSRPREQQVGMILALANATLERLGLDMRVTETNIRVDDAYRGPGYGHPTAETLEAISIAAQDEGLILDPVYTGKAMAGLVGHARQGILQPGQSVVFLHTGGTPALFAYHREMSDYLETAHR